MSILNYFQDELKISFSIIIIIKCRSRLAHIIYKILIPLRISSECINQCTDSTVEMASLKEIPKKGKKNIKINVSSITRYVFYSLLFGKGT